MKFTLPYPPKKQRPAFFRRYGLNAYYAGKHWAQRKEDAEAWHWTVLQELRRQKIPRRTLGHPLEIIFRWDDSLDVDNHAVMGKFILDTLKGYLIPDDDRRYVRRVTHEFHDKGVIEVEVREA